MYRVSRTDRRRMSHNVLALRRPKLAHISVLLRSNSGAVPLANVSYTIYTKAGRELRGKTDEDGLVYHSNVPPGDYQMEIEGFEHRVEVPTLPTHIDRRPLRVPDFLLFPEEDQYADEDLLVEEEDEVDVQPMGTLDENDDEWEDVEDYEPEEPEDA